MHILSPNTSISLSGETFQTFLVKSGTRKRYPLSLLLVQHYTVVNAIIQDKLSRGIRIGKEKVKTIFAEGMVLCLKMMWINDKMNSNNKNSDSVKIYIQKSITFTHTNNLLEVILGYKTSFTNKANKILRKKRIKLEENWKIPKAAKTDLK